MFLGLTSEESPKFKKIYGYIGIIHIYPVDFLIGITEIDKEAVFELNGAKVI